MNLLVGIIFHFILSNVLAQSYDTIVPIRKLTDIRTLSPEEFQTLNEAQIIGSYLAEKEGIEAKKNVHALQYAGIIEVGNPGQRMTVVFDVASSDTVILSSDYCTLTRKLFSPTCWSHRYYIESKSKRDDASHWKADMYPRFNLPYRKDTLSGRLIFDKMKIGNIEMNNLLIGTLDQWNIEYPYSKADGIVGVGLFHQSQLQSDAHFSKAHPSDKIRITDHNPLTMILLLEQATVGFHLHKDKQGNEIGELVIGEGDSLKRHIKKIQWFPRITTALPYLYITTEKLYFIRSYDGVRETVEFPKKSFAVIDPGTSVIAGPADAVHDINQMIFSGIKHVNHGTAQFDCRYQDQLPVIAFTMKNNDKKDVGFVLEPKDYVKRLQDKCTTGFLAMDSLPMFVIGDSFFHRHYVTLNYHSNQIGIAQYLFNDNQS